MLLTGDYVGIAGMFVVDARKFNKRDCWQPVVLQVGEKLRLILQVRVRSGRLRVERWRARVICRRRLQERRVFRVIREWLVMELEYDVRVGGRLRIVLQRHIPTAGIPFPGNAGVIETIANRNGVAGLRRIGVINQQTPGWIGRARRERRTRWLDSVHRVLPVEGKLIVVQSLSGWIVAGLPAGRNRRSPRRSLRPNQPLVIQKRTAVGRVEKIIAKRELLRQRALRQIRRIEVGKNQTGIVTPSHKLTEVAFLRLERAIVDLQLLGIKTVNDISGSGARVDVVGKIERYQRQRHTMIGPEREIAVRTCRKIRIGDSVAEWARRLVNQRSVIRVLVVLPQCVETVLEAVRARKLAVERIKSSSSLGK